MGTVEAQPLTTRCARILAEREHALLGVSALNGFFSVPVLTELLRWARGQFARVNVLVPGMELTGTLAARGYRPDKVVKKARAEINSTRNRVTRALNALEATDVGVFSWTDLYGVPAYTRMRAQLGHLFATDSTFREHCVAALAPIVDSGTPSEQQVEDAIPFLLAELPLVLDTPSIVGSRTSLFCYPRLMPMANWLFAGMLPVFPSSGQGILTIRLTSIAAGEDHEAQVLHRGGT